MSSIDTILFLAFLGYFVWDGLRRARTSQKAEGYFLAGRAVPWWAMGLSILATQASAITMVGAIGKGWQDGMRFVQFYLAMPLAMVILAFTLVPLFHRARVFTAYEYLGQRFGEKTRVLSALLFLAGRCLGLAVVLNAPAVILASAFDLDRTFTVCLMGVVAVAYTTAGGLAAVIATDVKQMAVMILGLVVTAMCLVIQLPEGVSLGNAFRLADASGHMQALDFRWDPNNRYTVWSSLLGGTFLFLSYFGTDQSQVQRHLSGRSLGDKQRAMLLSGFLKLPFQAFILVLGVLLFVVFLFERQPLSFRDGKTQAPGSIEAEYSQLARDYGTSRDRVKDRALDLMAHDDPQAERDFRAALRESNHLRSEAEALRTRAGISEEDVNYAFPYFIFHYLPVGIIGLLVAGIFAAALSSIDSELNALASVTALDLMGRKGPSDANAVRRSRLATLAWGLLVTWTAVQIGMAESLIEKVNELGSYFYGSLLGVFLLAFVKRANQRGAVTGLVAGMLSVGVSDLVTRSLTGDKLAFLFLNTIGTAP